MRYLSADVGGTFTDLVLVDAEDNNVYFDKVPSTPESAECVIRGIERITKRAEVDIKDIDLFVHGFTIATNVMLTRSGGSRLAMIVTEGFRDILHIGNCMRPYLYKLSQSKPEPLVPRSRIIEVEERLDAFGKIVKSLDPEEAIRAAKAVAAVKPEAIAVCLAFSYLDPTHEDLIASAIRQILPNIPVYLSSKVNPQIEEFPRASTTAIAAYVGGAVEKYITSLDEALRETGLVAPLRLMRSDGGVASPAATRQNPANMLLSGPAGGVIAGVNASEELGLDNIVTFDMGGTSADFSAIVDRKPRTTNSRELDGQPLRLPSSDIETISAGGGSIAWIDLGGALQIGPKSAGAVPGPVCYGQGGDKVTVTDATVVLGFLDPSEFLGGEMQIDRELALEAITEQIANPLGLSPEEAALGIVRVAATSMGQAIQQLLVERGLDSRDFALLAFGGAGPVFASLMARDLDMAEVVIPSNPGVYAARGLLMSDIRHTILASFQNELSEVEEDALGKVLRELQKEMDQALTRDSIRPDDRQFHFFGDMRAIGQYHELTVPLPAPVESGWWQPADVARLFHQFHERNYGHSDPGVSVELVNVRVEALGRIAKVDVRRSSRLTKGSATPSATRKIYLDASRGFEDCDVYRRTSLLPGQEIRGPSIIVQQDSTTVILDGQNATITEEGFLRIGEIEKQKRIDAAAADPITQAIFQHQVHGIAQEMAKSLKRAAFSSIIWSSNDYSCALLTPNGELLAQADTIPCQLGLMSPAIKQIFRDIPRDQWKPGDIIVCNDPYRGCSHTMDICLFSPVFNDGKLIAITSTIAHHEDIGGRVPGSCAADNEEVFAEGLILPPLKIFEGGVPNEAIFRIFKSNVRLPDSSMGDLQAQIAGCRTGERRTIDLANRYGNETFSTLAEACLDYAETYTRRAIDALPNGESEAAILVEDDVTSENPFRLHARVSVDGDSITVDVSGSDDQRPFALNNPASSTLSMIQYAIKCITSPDLMHNEGCVRPISVKLRPGSILDPIAPAAVGTRHHTQQALADVVLKALAPICPQMSAAGCTVAVTDVIVGGRDDRPEKNLGNSEPYYVIAELIGGGMGATSCGDGMNAVDTHGSNCATLSAEVFESRAPIRVLRTALVPGSGGAGKYRGGLAALRDYEMLASRGVLTICTQQTRDDTAPWGVAGGSPGGKSAIIMYADTDREENLGSKVVGRVLHKGDVWREINAGGGGWGDPTDRDPALAIRDKREGFV